MIGRSVLVMFFFFMVASPLAAQTTELASRTFWLGEEPSTLESYPPFFAPRRIGWIEEIVKTDPLLRDTVPHVELALRPTSETVGAVDGYYVPVGSDRLDRRYNLPGYRILGFPASPNDPMKHPNSLRYLSQDPGAGFDVSCGVDNLREKLRFCLVLATYPPDDGIRLKIRLYFPNDSVDRPTYFREVVERVRDLIYCLDVTEALRDVQADRPTLKGCRPDKTS